MVGFSTGALVVFTLMGLTEWAPKSTFWFWALVIGGGGVGHVLNQVLRQYFPPQ
jgi:hypothetical protein